MSENLFSKVDNVHIKGWTKAAVHAEHQSMYSPEAGTRLAATPRGSGYKAVAQWTKRLTRNEQMRVRNWKGVNILLSQDYGNNTTIPNVHMELSLLMEGVYCTRSKQ